MAKKALVEKWSKAPKFSTQAYNRCLICGRPRGYMRDFQMCRICFRDLASVGRIPGVTKSSW
ncbi:MAG TPA: type Z 30S ribosomal protein S14 [Candidatus Rifleibacterium sp.]|nr:type Z 30S ribosomal protein S14 [Candidatus Rifleibacterium sp.]HPT46868.1 type Z 30S ribosomal protein S14 [Candidatus Rifleibacterium sp.]